MSDLNKILVSFSGALLANLLALYVAGWQATLPAPEEKEPEPPEELVVMLEDIVPERVVPPPSGEKEKFYTETYANQESERPPENAPFESDRNTLAATEKPPTPDAMEAPVPTQDGDERIPSMSLQDHNYADAPNDGDIPKSAASPAGAPPTPPSPAAESRPEGSNPLLTMPSPAKNAPHPSDVFEVRNQNFLNPGPKIEGTETGEAEKDSTDTEPEGGLAETMELAKVDLPKREESFSDAMDIINRLKRFDPAPEASAPEENPDITEPDNPEAAQPATAQEPPPPQMEAPLQSSQKATQPVPPGRQPSEALLGEADAAAFSPEKRKNKMSGSLDNIGRTSSVDAEKTPLGQYKKAVSRAVERRWHEYRLAKMDFVSFGSLKISFQVDRNGKPGNVRVLHDDANTIVKGFSLAAIRDADIPAMPAEIVEILGNEPLEITYDIIIY